MLKIRKKSLINKMFNLNKNNKIILKNNLSNIRINSKSSLKYLKLGKILKTLKLN